MIKKINENTNLKCIYSKILKKFKNKPKQKILNKIVNLVIEEIKEKINNIDKLNKMFKKFIKKFNSNSNIEINLSNNLKISYPLILNMMKGHDLQGILNIIFFGKKENKQMKEYLFRILEKIPAYLLPKSLLTTMEDLINSKYFEDKSTVNNFNNSNKVIYEHPIQIIDNKTNTPISNKNI